MRLHHAGQDFEQESHELTADGLKKVEGIYQFGLTHVTREALDAYIGDQDVSANHPFHRSLVFRDLANMKLPEKNALRKQLVMFMNSKGVTPSDLMLLLSDHDKTMPQFALYTDRCPFPSGAMSSFFTEELVENRVEDGIIHNFMMLIALIASVIGLVGRIIMSSLLDHWIDYEQHTSNDVGVNERARAFRRTSIFNWGGAAADGPGGSVPRDVGNQSKNRRAAVQAHM